MRNKIQPQLVFLSGSTCSFIATNVVVVVVVQYKVLEVTGKTQSLGNSSAILLVGLVKVLDLSHLKLLSGILQMENDIVDESRSVVLAHDISEQHACLDIVIIWMIGLLANNDIAWQLEWILHQLSGLLWSTDRVWLIVRSTATVAVHSHWSISKVRVQLASQRGIDWNLGIVGTETMSMGVIVREQSTLQHLIGRWFNTRNEIGRRERRLLRLGKIILRITVQYHATHGDERIVLLGPNLGDIKGIEAVLCGLLMAHDLNVHGPSGLTTILDMIEQVTSGMIWILASQLDSLLNRQVLDTALRLKVELDPAGLTLLVHKLIRVTTIAVHVSVAVRCATITEQNGQLVQRLWTQGQKVPEHVSIAQIALWMSLLRVDEIGEFDGVTHEKDRSVVTDHVIVALLRVELDGKTARITSRIGTSLFSANGRKSRKNRSSLSNLVQEGGLGVASHVVGHFKVAVSTGALGMDDTFGDALAIKVGQLVNEMVVLEEDGTVGTDGERVLVIGDWMTKLVGHGVGIVVVVGHGWCCVVSDGFQSKAFCVQRKNVSCCFFWTSSRFRLLVGL